MAGTEENVALWDFDCPQFVDFREPLPIEDNADEWFEQKHDGNAPLAELLEEHGSTPELASESQGRPRRILRQRSNNQENILNGPKRVPCPKPKPNPAPSAPRRSGGKKSKELEKVEVFVSAPSTPTTSSEQQEEVQESAAKEVEPQMAVSEEPAMPESQEPKKGDGEEDKEGSVPQNPDLKEQEMESSQEQKSAQNASSSKTVDFGKAEQKEHPTNRVRSMTKGRSLGNICTDIDKWRGKATVATTQKPSNNPSKLSSSSKISTSMSKLAAGEGPSEDHGVRRSPRLLARSVAVVGSSLSRDQSVEVVDMAASGKATQVSDHTSRKRQASDGAKTNSSKKMRRSVSASQVEGTDNNSTKRGGCHRRGRSGSLASEGRKRCSEEMCVQDEDGTQSSKLVKLTIPVTPNMMKRTAVLPAVVSKGKSTEELELEEMESKRRELSHHIRQNQENCKLALSAAGYQRPHSHREPTVPQEFQFHTDARLKSAPAPADKGEIKPSEFTRMLRSQDKSTAASALKGLTLPQPFKLTETRKQAAANTKFRSMAEEIVNFQKETPDRFRSRPRANTGSDSKARGRSHSPKLTVPKTPNLQTKGRYRPVTAPSRKEQEEQELEEMKKNQFHACPLNRKILEVPNTGVPAVPRKPPTQPEEFHLSMERRLQERERPAEEGEKFEFHAQPVPKAILEGPVGVKKVKPAPLTVPQSPAFALKHRVRLPIEVPEETGQQELYKRSQAVPHLGVPFQPTLSHRHTVPQPFSFEGRPSARNNSSQEEEQIHEFKANPLPSLSPDTLPLRKPKEPTCPEPFHLAIDERGKRHQEAFARKLEEENRKQKESLRFKAHPAEVVHREPFIPQKSTKPLTDISDLELNTERRAEQREDFELRKKQREAEIEAIRQQREEEEEARHRDEVARLRHELVHKANPIRHYRGVQIRPSDKPLTQAESPRFSERLRTKRL